MHANLCQAAPSVVYFAGRGRDLGAFVENWVQGAPCGISQLHILAGDDASESIHDKGVLNGIASGRVTVAYTALASPDEWGKDCPGSDAKHNYDQFWAAFTGRPDPCTGQPLTADKDVPTLSFDPADLGSGQAMLTHDAAVAAISAGRRDAVGLATRAWRPASCTSSTARRCCRVPADGSRSARRHPRGQAHPGRPARLGRHDQNDRPDLAPRRHPQPEPAAARRQGGTGLLTPRAAPGGASLHAGAPGPA